MSRKRRISNLHPEGWSTGQPFIGSKHMTAYHQETSGEQGMGATYLSLTHVMPPTEDDNSNVLRLFSVNRGEKLDILVDDTHADVIYRGIFLALQGPPKTKEEVIASLGVEGHESVEFASQVFDALEAELLITATTSLASAFHRTTVNPPIYPSAPLSAEKLARKVTTYDIKTGDHTHKIEAQPQFERETTRAFDPTATMPLADLERILVDTYRTSVDEARPTPSPGGIYPVTLHVLNHSGRVEDSDNSFTTGVWQYDPQNLTLERQISFGSSSGKNAVEYLTNNTEAADPVIWVLLGTDVAAFEEKYGNTAMMFNGIAIGSVMQRLLEEADRMGYQALTLNGINHVYGDEILHNDGSRHVALAIGLGRAAEQAREKRGQSVKDVLDKIRTGTESIIHETGGMTIGESARTGMPSGFTGAWARYDQGLANGETVDGYSFGTASTSSEAELKATAEALERVSSANVRIDVSRTPAIELTDPWIHPADIMPLDALQRAIANVTQFRPDEPTDWTAGHNVLSGERVLAPSSLIYYPYVDGEAVSRVSSNGVAAHFETSEVVRRGLLELVERDAIMRTWILQQSPDRVSYGSLPESIRYRVDEITSRGRRVDILQLEQEIGIPTYMVAIRGDRFPLFYVGAAANLDPELALQKAMDEAVAGVATRIMSEEASRSAAGKKQIEGKFDVDSHAMLYADNPEMLQTLDWLFSGNVADLPDVTKIPSNQDVMQRYDPAVFMMDNPAAGNGLKIGRVIAKDLIPITFGTHGVPYQHHSLPAGTRPPANPHFFS